jgi:7-carboxy-7-deazaguanine synthase
MNVSEIFYSIQGEGFFVGTPSVFFRFSGCPLRCVWCDTPYTSWHPEKNHINHEQALGTIEKFGATHVVFTGGEPFSQAKDLERLCQDLSHDQMITIETAGVIYHPVEADLISLSPKLSNSVPTDTKFAERHDKKRLNYEVLAEFNDNYACQWKFVIQSQADLEEVEDLEVQFKLDNQQIYLMPEGRTQKEVSQKSRWLAEVCKENGWRFSPRLHVDIWGDERGV